MKILGVCFGVVGAILLAIAAFLYLHELSFLSNAETSNGTVTAYSSYTDSDGSTLYCPVIKFTTREGQNISYTGSDCSAPADYKVGDPVQIVYDPKNTKHIQIRNIGEEYVGTIITGLIGLPFFIVGAWIFWAHRRKI